MTWDRFSPSSLMRSMGSVDVLVVSAFFVVAEAGWLRRAEVAACWACKARTGTRHVTPKRTVVLSSRRMVAGLREDSRHRRKVGSGLHDLESRPELGGNLGATGTLYDVSAQVSRPSITIPGKRFASGAGKVHSGRMIR